MALMYMYQKNPFTHHLHSWFYTEYCHQTTWCVVHCKQQNQNYNSLLLLWEREKFNNWTPKYMFTNSFCLFAWLLVYLLACKLLVCPVFLFVCLCSCCYFAITFYVSKHFIFMYEMLKEHSQLAHTCIRHHFIANLHITKMQ